MNIHERNLSTETQTPHHAAEDMLLLKFEKFGKSNLIFEKSLRSLIQKKKIRRIEILKRYLIVFNHYVCHICSLMLSVHVKTKKSIMNQFF